MIRAEALAALYRWREVGFAAVLGAFGLWLFALGGLVLAPLGTALLALAVVLGLTAWRRLRFAQEVAAPGVVEVLEGQVSYMGPGSGGFVSLTELVEIRLVTLRGRRIWRLKQADGQALLVPVDATGAERLFDGFTSLPGIDMAALVEALTPSGAAPGQGLLPIPTTGPAEMRVIWQRKGKGLVAGQP